MRLLYHLIPLIPPLLLPPIVSTLSIRDDRIRCFTPLYPPGSPPFFIPSRSDTVRLEAILNEEDTRRPPRISTFANADEFPPGMVDFELPLAKRSGSALALIQMQTGWEHRVGHAVVSGIGLVLVQIQGYCETRGNLGGWVDVGPGVWVYLKGMNTDPAAVGGGLDGNVTDGGGPPCWNSQVGRSHDEGVETDRG